MRKRSLIIATLSVVALSLLTLGLFACSEKLKGEPLSPADGLFRIDAKKIGAGDVRFFRYNTHGKDVVFMVARSDTGFIKTAFDACITCYPHKMGYTQEEDCVVCRYCGNRFKLEELNKGIGNCVPIGISHRLEGNTVVIDLKDIEAGAAWF